MSIKKVIGGFAILGLTLLGTANLVSVVPKTVIAQNIETEVTAENTKIDINQVEFDSSTKFGARINTVFAKEQVKNEACGDTITTGKFDPNLKASVIKSIKTACITGEAKQSWLKLVWDNGLIGWVQNPKETQATVSNTTFEGVKTLGFGDYFQDFLTIKASANSVTCKNFTAQIIDLKILNQYPNLDLNDNGIGCDGLPKNPNDPQQVFKNSFDTDGSGRVNCGDFDSQVTDTEILTLFPRLDADSDGIGCEANSTVAQISSSTILNGYAGSYNPYFEDVQLSETMLSNNSSDQNWSALGGNLISVLQNDYRTLFGNDADCNSFDFGCQMTQSLAGLGRRGMWMFHFTTGILQGIGQSIADLLTLIFDLVSKGLSAVQNIMDGLYNLITNPSLIVKLVYDELEGFMGGDYISRANKLGRLIGSVLLDGIEFFTGIGVGALALSAVSKIATSSKVVSRIVNFTKFAGKGYKIADKFEIGIKIVKNGVGIAREQAVRFAQTLSNSDWLDFVKYVDDADKPALQKLRELLQKCASQVVSFDIWNIFTVKANAQAVGELCDLAKTIRSDLQAKYPDFDPVKYDALVRGKTATEVAKISGELYGKPDLWKKTIALRSVNSVNFSKNYLFRGKPKHQPITKLDGTERTWKEIIKDTLNNEPAVYKPTIWNNIETIERKAFDTGYADPNGIYVWYKHSEIVGASGGVETKYMRIDYSGGQYHGHPVVNSRDGLTKEIINKLGK